MRNLLLGLCLLLPTLSFAQDASEYRVIPSITDWIEEINNWPDTIYKVENIKVIIDIKKDSLIAENYLIRQGSLEEVAATINKPLDITRLIIDNDFGNSANNGNYALKNIRFKESVDIRDYQSLVLHSSNLVFEKRLAITDQKRYTYFNFWDCEFGESVGLFDFEESSAIGLFSCVVQDYLQVTRTPGRPDIRIERTEIPRLLMPGSYITLLTIRDSKIEEISLPRVNFETTAHLINNDIQSINISGAVLPANNTYMPFEQVNGKIYVQAFSSSNPNANKYFVTDSMNFDQKEEYDLLIGSYKLLQDRYQKRGDQDSYNAAYVEMKNIETRRLAFLYSKDPNFNRYFTWKINQFLKTFSMYGTEPARSIIFSLYVIFGFALIYLFFPNHWDSHGKNRIIDRFSFFLKYMKKDAGMHDVYLEEKQGDILAYDDYKLLLESSGKDVPKFFQVTGLPLYKWAISSTKMTAGFLSRVDVMKGTWSELPTSKRVWKSTLLITAFLIALTYDILIKMLNALMLSINTFTTLGFGEIPIKGLPRYLAIIQGFIGWFMLTIFSVSLISQLLN